MQLGIDLLLENQKVFLSLGFDGLRLLTVFWFFLFFNAGLSYLYEKTHYFMLRDLTVGYRRQNIATLEGLMQQGNF